jgi:hypothetical protein
MKNSTIMFSTSHDYDGKTCFILSVKEDDK